MRQFLKSGQRFEVSRLPWSPWSQKLSDWKTIGIISTRGLDQILWHYLLNCFCVRLTIDSPSIVNLSTTSQIRFNYPLQWDYIIWERYGQAQGCLHNGYTKRTKQKRQRCSKTERWKTWHLNLGIVSLIFKYRTNKKKWHKVFIAEIILYKATSTHDYQTLWGSYCKMF